MLQICCAGRRVPREPRVRVSRSSGGNPLRRQLASKSTGLESMDQLSGYARRPFSFVLRYLRARPVAHLIILTAVMAAVACSVGTQYGVKFLVDSLSSGPAHANRV